MLFKDRNLNIAFIISTSWHLIFMFAVTPVLVSGDIKENSTRVSFLGSILERVTGETFHPLAVGDTFQHRDMDMGHFPLESVPYCERAESAPYRAPEAEQRDKEQFIFSGDKYKMPLFKLHYKKEEKRKIKFKDALIDGEARDRLILYRPELCGVPLFSSNFSSNYNVSIRFRISRDGFVERPECIISSGSSEVDQMALRYIRRWQFVPLDDEVQEGIVRVNFVNTD